MNETALIVAEKLDIAVLFSGDGMDKILKEIESKAMAHVPDLTTAQGRDDIKSMAYKVAQSKTLIDGLGKDLVSDWKKKAKAIDDHRKTARDFLDDLKVKVRQPLTDWETVEAEKKEEADRKEREKVDARIAELAAFGKTLPFFEVAGWDDDKYNEVVRTVRAEHEAEQKRLADEKDFYDRSNKLYSIGMTFSGSQFIYGKGDTIYIFKEDLLTLTKNQFNAIFEDFSERINEIKSSEAAARKAEAERLEKQRQEQEAEAARLAEAQKKIAEANAKIEAEKKALEDAKRKEQERLEREAFEAKTREIARIDAEKAEKDRQEKEAWEAKEKAEREAAEKERQEALKPDKEKLVFWADSLLDMMAPETSVPAANKIANEAILGIYGIAHEIHSKAGRL